MWPGMAPAGWPVLSRSEGRGCSAGALSFAKGGMLTFAYRLEFFANSLTSAQSQRRSVNSRCSSSRSCLPPFFITNTCATHHRHITRPSATIGSTCDARPKVCDLRQDGPPELQQPHLSALFDNFDNTLRRPAKISSRRNPASEPGIELTLYSGIFYV